MIADGICIAVVIVNLTGIWNKQDQQTLDRAQTRCAQLYPEAPCLKKLIKKDESTYNAICGERQTKWMALNAKN